MIRALLAALLLLGSLSAATPQAGYPVGPNPPAGLFSTNGALKGNGSGTVSQAACADLSNAGGYCSISAGALTNSLAGDVALSNVANYFDGPVVAQGSTGTWFASGAVDVVDTTASASIICKLWDGTTVIASGFGKTLAASSSMSIALSGFLASPAGNLRISCRDLTSTSGAIQANGSGNSKDSTITAFRIN